MDYPAASPTAQAGIRQSIAFFNWSDAPQLVTLPRARLGHTGAVAVENFWTGARETWEDEFISQRLDGRSAVLYDVLE